MTATSPPLVPARRGLRAVVARHPVPAMLVMMFAVSWAILIPPALAGIDLVPVFLLIAVLFGQLLPAVLVTAAVGGRPAVRELFSRVFRWRVSMSTWTTSTARFRAWQGGRPPTSSSTRSPTPRPPTSSCTSMATPPPRPDGQGRPGRLRSPALRRQAHPGRPQPRRSRHRATGGHTPCRLNACEPADLSP
jgi:hypothetical protein